jgi:hypothetical protein
MSVFAGGIKNKIKQSKISAVPKHHVIKLYKMHKGKAPHIPDLPSSLHGLATILSQEVSSSVSTIKNVI